MSSYIQVRRQGMVIMLQASRGKGKPCDWEAGSAHNTDVLARVQADLKALFFMLRASSSGKACAQPHDPSLWKAQLDLQTKHHKSLNFNPYLPNPS